MRTIRELRRQRLPTVWTRIDGGTGKIGARYTHPSGWWIEHCGHPTANWPYALYSPEGRLQLAPNGRAWGSLVEAHLEVMRRLVAATK
jgi:hypothetical protein